MLMHPLRGVIVTVVLVGLLVAVVAVLTGVLLVLALAVGTAVLNMIYLPSAARRLRISADRLALGLIPFMILAGVLIGGVEGAGWAVGIWLVAIGLPRAIGHDVLRRVRRRLESRVSYYDVPPRPVADGATRPTADPGGRPLPRANDPGRGESGP